MDNYPFKIAKSLKVPYVLVFNADMELLRYKPTEFLIKVPYALVFNAYMELLR